MKNLLSDINDFVPTVYSENYYIEILDEIKKICIGIDKLLDQ